VARSRADGPSPLVPTRQNCRSECVAGWVHGTGQQRVIGRDTRFDKVPNSMHTGEIVQCGTSRRP